MDAQPCRRFFLEPNPTFHRRYEVLREFLVDHCPAGEIAAQLGDKLTAFNVMIDRFRAQVRQRQVPLLFVPDGRGRPGGSCPRGSKGRRRARPDGERPPDPGRPAVGTRMPQSGGRERVEVSDSRREAPCSR